VIEDSVAMRLMRLASKTNLIFSNSMNYTTQMGWYVVYVNSRQERSVQKFLEGMSLEAYAPLVKRIKKWSDRQKTVEVPLFPSYVFVKIYSSMDFYKALSVKGVVNYIRFGTSYARIREEEMERIKLLLELDGVTDIDLDNVYLKKGETYRIKNGPFQGFDCEVLDTKNKRKLIVRIDSLQQSIVATIPKHHLDPTVKL
jgi:transcription antitermination factor NusG